MSSKIKLYIKQIIGITVGIAIAALGLDLFLIPLKVVSGGISGLATIVYYVFGAPVWLVSLCINVPLFLIGLKILGKKFGVQTLYATVMLSVFLALFSDFRYPGSDLFITVVFGGALAGLGLGIVFRMGATTGGTDIIAGIINYYLPHFSMGSILILVDAVIILISGLVFGAERALYGVIAVFVQGKVIDFIEIGLNHSKMILIISEKPDEISDLIMSKMDRGITILKGKGGYTKEEKDVILCVVSRSETSTVMQLVHLLDKKAFMIVTDVNEVYGEGFNIKEINIAKKTAKIAEENKKEASENG